MGAPSVTYPLTNGTTASDEHVDQNNQDLIMAMTDGTKDFSIGTLTTANMTLNHTAYVYGLLNVKGSVSVGTDSSSLATFGANLTPAVSAANNLGSTSLSWSKLSLGTTLGMAATPDANTAYTEMIPKAACVMKIGGLWNVRSSFNIKTISGLTSTVGNPLITFTFGTPMANENYVVCANRDADGTPTGNYAVRVASQTTTGFVLGIFLSGVGQFDDVTLVVFGTQ